jgi:hypothetical protein
MDAVLKSVNIDKLREITPRLSARTIPISSVLRIVLDILETSDLSDTQKVDICKRQIRSLTDGLEE